jgi:hypothetical protein
MAGRLRTEQRLGLRCKEAQEFDIADGPFPTQLWKAFHTGRELCHKRNKNNRKSSHVPKAREPKE